MCRIREIVVTMVLTCATSIAIAADACKVPVGADEIINGIQAGFDDGAPFHQAFFVGGVRGFVDLEANGFGVISDQCQSDHIWIGVNFGDFGASAADAIAALTASRKNFLRFDFFVDGVPLGIGLRTENRVRSNPFAAPADPFYAYGLAGTIIDPFSLAPGLHTAQVIIQIELAGIPVSFPLEANFNVLPAKANKIK